MWSATARRRMLLFQRSRGLNYFLFVLLQFYIISFIPFFNRSIVNYIKHSINAQSIHQTIRLSLLVNQGTYMIFLLSFSCIILCFRSLSLSLSLVSLKFVNHFVWVWRPFNKQLLDEVEHDIMNYQNRGLCYLPKPKAEADNTDTRFW